MSNLIDKSLKIASYGVGGIDIAKGNFSQGMLLINSQRQISQLQNIDKEIKAGNEVLYRGFVALEDHLEEINFTNEKGFDELSSGINELSQDLKALDRGITEMGVEIVTAIYAQTLEQRVFQSQVIQNNELIIDILDRVLIENEKQTTALENPDQTLSIEKLKTAKKMMKLFDPELNNVERINEAIGMSKDAIEKDPFNEEAVFYCAKWMNLLGIAGWKEMYVDAMQKTKIELENEIESQANLAQDNAARLSIAASIDIIESLDFKLFAEKFYLFAKQYCSESFLINLEVFYYFYWCSESNEEEANKHLYNCFNKFGKKVFYDEIMKNPMALGFDIFWSFLIKEEKDRQWAEELDRNQRADYEKSQEEQRIKSKKVKAEEVKLEAKQVNKVKSELNKKINQKIQSIQKQINKLSFNPLPEDLNFTNKIEVVYGSEIFPSMEVFLSIDHELNIFNWKPSKNKLSSIESTSSGYDNLLDLCFEKVIAAEEKLVNIILDYVGYHMSVVDDHKKLGEMASVLQENAENLVAYEFANDLENIKPERKSLKNTATLLKNNLDVIYGINELEIEYAKIFNPLSKEKSIKGIIKEVFTYISIISYFINYAKLSLDEVTQLSSDDINRICDQNIQFDYEDLFEGLEFFFCDLIWLITHMPHLHNNVSFEIFSLNKELVEKLEAFDLSTFYNALNEYILIIDRGDVSSFSAIEEVSQLFD
jgi:hypothetical protein